MANGEANGNGGNGHGNGRERLDSWKAIAAYLGRDEATLRRWEASRGLPIRRLPGKRGASVYAYRDEIDAWLLTGGQAAAPAAPELQAPQQTPPPMPPAMPAPARARNRVPWAMAILIIALAAVAAVYFPSRSQAVSEGMHVEVTESAVLARDEDKQRLWTYNYEDTHRHVLSQINETMRLSRAAPATVFAASAIRFRRSDNRVDSGRLTALDTRGRFRWRFEFDDAITVGGRTYAGPWGIDGYAIDEGQGPRRIAIAAHDYTWSPSIVAVLDDSGRRVMRYVNDGWIERVQWLPGGRLAASGYSMAHAGGMMALLDPARVDGRSPDEGAHRCENCGGDLPLQLVVMPRSEVNIATASRFNRALVDLSGDRLVVRTEEVPSSGQGPAEAIYEFDAGLQLLSAAYSERYWELHDEMFALKRLDHERANCPHRDGPAAYRRWSAAAGWTTVEVTR